MKRTLILFICQVFFCRVASFRLTGIPFRTRTSLCAAANDDKGAPPAYSYVEGGDYDDRRAEIEAMGGDPFFLSDDEDDKNEVTGEKNNESFVTNLETPMGGPDPTAQAEERYATDGKGPTPPPKKEAVDEDWEWDGTIDEDAHMMDF